MVRGLTDKAGSWEARRVEMAQAGLLRDLAVRPVRVPAPRPDQVRVRIEAVALTFRELLRALGVYPGPAEGGAVTFDGDFVGTVVDVGDRVTTLDPGARVLGWGRAVLASAITTGAASLVSLACARGACGDELTNACGLATLGAYVAPLHGMFDRGGLQAADSVLIHAAAGGTGLAAAHYARGLGCELFLTAGRPSKRDYLETLGPRLLASSRDSEFAAAVRAATDGRGVDLVLNSLSGPLLRAGLTCLAIGGRFVDLSRRDIEQDTSLPMSLFRNNGSYLAVNVQDLPTAKIADLYRRVVHDHAAAAIPVLPYEAFPLADAAKAFAYFRRARHVGRVILSPLLDTFD